MMSTNIDYSLLVRAAHNERRRSREIADQANIAFLISLLGVGAAVMFGGLAIVFGMLYVIHLALKWVGVT